jgi:hypothetical protein
MISKVLNCSHFVASHSTFCISRVFHSHSVGSLSKFCASGRVSEVVICGFFFSPVSDHFCR